jgi:hypothetical protein
VVPDRRKPEIHAAIISWDGYGDAARQIAGAVAPCVTSLRVIYSNRAEAQETGPGDWIAVANTDFFGAKFHRAIETHEAGIPTRPFQTGHRLSIAAGTCLADTPILQFGHRTSRIPPFRTAG